MDLLEAAAVAVEGPVNHVVKGNFIFICTPRVREDRIWWDFTVEELPRQGDLPTFVESQKTHGGQYSRSEGSWIVSHANIDNFDVMLGDTVARSSWNTRQRLSLSLEDARKLLCVALVPGYCRYQRNPIS